VRFAALLAELADMGTTPSDEADDFSELDHALQCAFELAQRAPADSELQIAGLVHDIGHRFGGDDQHGRLGAEYLRPVLGDRVAGLVEAHVPAKRYLVVFDPDYALSEVSRMTLAVQGGPMSSGEIAAFRAAPHWEAALTLRRADDAAKTPGRDVPGLDHWLPLLRHLAGAG
jgi:predicted HD phosphohydrolase